MSPPPRSGRASGPGRAIPGLTPTLGIALVWVSLLVAIPLASLIVRPWRDGPQHVLHALTDPRTIAALRLSFTTAVLAALISMIAGLVLAWTIERIRPPGWRLLDLLVDLPFALPTAVAGITLTTLYASHGWIGARLAPLGIRVAYTDAGITLALIFVGLPFAVRSTAPVLRALPPELEEAARTLGAHPVQIARRVLLPALAPAMLTGFGLALARGVGEYGSVIFIAGNRPGLSEIAPLLIVIRLQEFDYAGAASIGLLMLAFSAICLLALALLRRALPASRAVAA